MNEAQRLWEAATSAHSGSTRPYAEGRPPVGIVDYAQLPEALRGLLAVRALSYRELVRRDGSRVLRRSTVGAVLRGERSASREVTLAIVRACSVSDRACAEWAAVWDRVGEPFRARMEHKRGQIAYARLRSVGW